jgi:hypothetical protein
MMQIGRETVPERLVPANKVHHVDEDEKACDEDAPRPDEAPLIFDKIDGNGQKDRDQGHQQGVPQEKAGQCP